MAAAEIDIKRLDAERELEMIEVQMGLREPEPIEAAPTEETIEPQAEESEEDPRG
jgi:phage shock protein A